jgi:hypothetical protein
MAILLGLLSARSSARSHSSLDASERGTVVEVRDEMT